MFIKELAKKKKKLISSKQGSFRISFKHENNLSGIFLILNVDHQSLRDVISFCLTSLTTLCRHKKQPK